MKLSSYAVALAHCPNYELLELKTTIDALCHSLAFSVGHGHKVLLKPNLVSASRPDGLALTHPQVLRAVTEWFIDHGTAVSIGDSPAFGSSSSVMAQCGITKALAGLPVTFLPFNRQRSIRTANQISISLADDVFQHDLLINLPKLKAHDQLRVTMAVKNYFGVVVAWRKALAHMRYGDDDRFVRLLVDLLDLLPEGLSLIDGVMAMHRHGPLSGDPLEVGVLGASLNPIALDSAMLAIIGLPFEASPLWQECARRNLPGSYLTELTFPLAQPEALAVTGFITPAKLDPIRFQAWRFLRNSLTKFFR
jgi:uncharacterized protein (DUF362 family)